MTGLQQEDSVKQPYIVILGASAGGLEALQQFFDHMPAESGIAFIVAMHFPAGHKSSLDTLLSRHTSLPACFLDNQVSLEPNTIHIIPPGKNIYSTAGRLIVDDFQAENRIDFAMNTLASVAGERVIAVILSGNGIDGVEGMLAIHQHGGFVIVQSPNTARFDGMPCAALETRATDCIMPPNEMPGALMEYVRDPRSARDQFEPESGEFSERGAYGAIFALLRKTFSIDFSCYKTTTVGRRIKRRMDFRQVDNTGDFAALLAQDTNELDRLYRDLLIGVTEFFRDPKAFEFLANEVIPPAMQSLPPGEPLRVWSAGCATGEEAYSLAISFLEKAEELKFSGEIKIFATDVHKASLEAASQGIFDIQSLENVSPERRERFFTQLDDSHFQASNDLRKLLVFAHHNILEDPPFTRIDLVCCRNLLIYLQPEAQQKVLSQFHFALCCQGILFLGGSEGLNLPPGEFEPLLPAGKIYRKIRDVRLPTTPITRINHHNRVIASTVPRMECRSAISIDRHLLHDYDVLLSRNIPPGILIDGERRILHYFGNIEQFLKPPQGRAENDVLKIVAEDLKPTLSSALHRAIRERTGVTAENVHTSCNDEKSFLSLIIDRIGHENNEPAHYLISFRIRQSESAAGEPARIPLSISGSDNVGNLQRRIEDLEQELISTRESLHMTIEELQASNEQLDLTNEELISTNEELQSTNEELKSVNEDLQSVNSELETKNSVLRDLNRDHENLLASTEMGMFFLDRELRVRKFNAPLTSFFKLLPQDVGRPLAHIASSLPSTDQLIIDAQAVLASGGTVEKDIQLPANQWLLCRTLPFRTEAGSIEGIVMTFTDISIIKAAEEKIFQMNAELELKVQERTEELVLANRRQAESEMRYKHFSELTSDFVYSCVRTPDTPFRIDWISGSCIRITGYSSDEILQKGCWLPLTHPDDFQLVWDYLSDFEPGRSDTKEFRLIDKNGNTCWIKDHSRCVWHEELPGHYRLYGAAQDITEQRKLEEQLLHAQKMESVGTLAGGVAHDFNNILTVITGNASLLQIKMGKESPLCHFTQQILSATERAANLTKSLLAFSRKQAINTRPANLNIIVESTRRFLARMINEDITLDIDLSEEKLTVLADSSQIEQVLMNLAVNARDAMPNGGKIQISTSSIEIDQEFADSHKLNLGKYAVVTFTDTGHGMGKEIKERIFEPFFTTKEVGKGTGLGLSIAYGIIRQHNGIITVASRPGKGTTFTTYLPLVERETPMKNPTESSLVNGSGTVLLAEDDKCVRDVTVAMLEECGYQVITASDGLEAVGKFSQNRDSIDLVILDVIMPKKNGKEAYDEIIAMQPGTKIIFTSGYTDDILNSKGIGETDIVLLQKPISPPQFMQTLKEIMGSSN